ncbi:ABC transporter ATP-binding protein [Geminicoccus flavidas]|uniref:ABC transporter ATP-binding protein n=1 Tax=Geminicoccus flavidas TaxID=2506407 RepID=UPI00135A47E7
MPALAVEDVAYAYGRRQALDRVSFTIPPGRFAVLLGLNGAGKSTLFQLVTRLFATRQGTIRIFGHNVLQEAGAALRRLGVVFQARTLDLDLTVRQNLAYHAALHGIGRSHAKARAAEVLERVDLARRVSERARNLSGGQMRRLEIARALLHQPSLILLDEPTVGLDIAARADILAHVRDLVARDGVAVLWATHLVDEIAKDDQVLVLHQGRLLADGRLDALLATTGAVDAEGAFRRLIKRPGAAP